MHIQSSVEGKTPGHFGGLEASYEIDTLNLLTVSGSLNATWNKVYSLNDYTMSTSQYAPVYSYRQSGKVQRECLIVVHGLQSVSQNILVPEYGITVSYSFGNLKEKVRKVRRSIENDDLKQEGK